MCGVEVAGCCCDISPAMEPVSGVPILKVANAGVVVVGRRELFSLLFSSRVMGINPYCCVGLLPGGVPSVTTIVSIPTLKNVSNMHLAIR